MDEYQKKVARSISLLRSIGTDSPVEVAYSGGKDSDVILDLVRKSGIKYRAIYRSTTLDPPGTIQHCISKGVEIRRPKESFLNLVRRKGMPTRRCRFCCEKLKEFKILDTCVQGIRRCESYKRSSLYSSEDPVICRLYGKNKKNHVNVVLPILDYTDEDVERYIKENKIRCHPLYYGDDGLFMVGKRLGCTACPLKGDNGLAELRKVPGLVRVILANLTYWWDEHPNTKCHEKFSSPAELFIHNVFSRTYLQHKRFVEKNIPDHDYIKWLEHYFIINLHYLPKLYR